MFTIWIKVSESGMEWGEMARWRLFCDGIVVMGGDFLGFG